MVGNLTRKIKKMSKCHRTIEYNRTRKGSIVFEKVRSSSTLYDIVRLPTKYCFEFFAIIYVPVHAHIVNQIRLLRSNLLRTVTSSVNILEDKTEPKYWGAKVPTKLG